MQSALLTLINANPLKLAVNGIIIPGECASQNFDLVESQYGPLKVTTLATLYQQCRRMHCHTYGSTLVICAFCLGLG